jgi:hypothetical protein
LLGDVVLDTKTNLEKTHDGTESGAMPDKNENAKMQKHKN